MKRDTDWYFDSKDFYIDVHKDDKGLYSIYFRNRDTNEEAWLDQADTESIG